jgi:type IV secretory pathway ATPase VirB11/archaellum biosynthesis ATPase
MQILNDPTPWWGSIDSQPLSIIDLIAAGTIPATEAGALWWAVERGASFFTAGGPSGAGKSTLANTLLGFLPAAARVYVVSGRDDPLTLPAGREPTYLLISELSSHGRPFYLSGPAAGRAFALLRTGARMIGTLHAESVAEAVDDVLSAEMGIPAGDIARLTFIAIIRVDGPRDMHGRVERRRTDLTRRVIEIGLLRAGDAGVRVLSLAKWNERAERLEPASAPAGIAALAEWAGTDVATAQAAIAGRTGVLSDLLQAGRRSPDDVAAAVRAFRATRIS